MTIKDKFNKQRAIKFLVDHNMDTSENLKRLEAVNYTANYIEIGGVRRAREDVKAKPDGKNIFQHCATTYFKRDEKTMKKQTALLASQGMEIPSKEHYARSMAALP